MIKPSRFFCGERKTEEGNWGEGRKWSACNQSPHNSTFLHSNSVRQMLIGRDMSRAAVSYSLAVRLASACLKITILELVFLKTLVCSLEYAITSLICELRDFFSLKRQIVYIQFGHHSIFHGYIARSGAPDVFNETIEFWNYKRQVNLYIVIYDSLGCS